MLCVIRDHNRGPRFISLRLPLVAKVNVISKINFLKVNEINKNNFEAKVRGNLGQKGCPRDSLTPTQEQIER